MFLNFGKGIRMLFTPVFTPFKSLPWLTLLFCCLFHLLSTVLQIPILSPVCCFGIQLFLWIRLPRVLSFLSPPTSSTFLSLSLSSISCSCCPSLSSNSHNSLTPPCTHLYTVPLSSFSSLLTTLFIFPIFVVISLSTLT